MPNIRRRTFTSTLAVKAGILVVASLLSIFITIGCSSSLLPGAKTQEEWARAIDVLMHAMVNKDADQAYALFSTRAHKQFPLAGIQRLLEGNNYALFDGYTATQVKHWNVTTLATSDGQTTTVQLDGVISYEGPYTGTLKATLEQENGAWKFDSFNVTVPPAKLEEYLSKLPQ